MVVKIMCKQCEWTYTTGMDGVDRACVGHRAGVHHTDPSTAFNVNALPAVLTVSDQSTCMVKA